MSALDRKLIRNLWEMKGQVLAICAVIACGIATYVMSLSTMESLRTTQERYYRDYRFADVFAGLKRAPLSLADRIREIPGVDRVGPRVVRDVTLDVGDFPEPVIGRLISIPDFDEPPLNSLHLRSGRWIEPGHSGEVLANEAFADAHGLKPGDTIDAVINGRKRDLTLVGTAITPEYIYQLREGEILPDDKRFGLLWMGETELSSAFDMHGGFNNVTLSVSHATSIPDVLRRLDGLIEPYGGLGAYDRGEQTSHQYIDNEIQQLRSMGIVAPIIFLSVAAFLLNVVLSRLITMQREEIAALKAFGYTGYEIGWHYVKFVLLIVTIGSLIGTAVGLWMGRGMTELYTSWFRFPVLELRFDWRIIGSAYLVSAAGGLLGTLAAVRQAVKLPPAEAMRPEPPGEYRPTVIERLGLQRLFPQSARIVLRNLERRPLKAGMSILGIAMGIAVLVVGNYSKDSIDYVLEMQFQQAQRQDITVGFVDSLTSDALHELEHLRGVRRVEPFRVVPARLRSAHHSRRVGITGLPRGGELFLPLDLDGDLIDVPPDGLLLSRALANVLEARIGDAVQVDVLEGQRPRHQLRVTAVMDDFSGLSAYMDLDGLHQLMQEGENLSGAYLTVDPLAEDELYTTLKNTPYVASVTIKTAAIESFEKTIAESMLQMQAFIMMFATVIAFGVVYNSARISLSERSRELATLRVIGFTRGEISAILLGELALLTLAAIPVGLFIGYEFARLTATSMVDAEMFRIPLVIAPSTYALAVVVIVVAALLSGLVVRRRLDHLDLIAVLKTRD